MGATIKLLKALFIGFISTPVFFVVISAFLYDLSIEFDLGLFIIYKGSPISIHSVIYWLLLLHPESGSTKAIFFVSLSWIFGWLLVWSRTREIRVVLSAMLLAYFLYIIYLVSFWRVSIVLIFPDQFIQLLVTMTVCISFHMLDKIRPKKTIFDKLTEIGYVFPDYWKKSYDLPIICPKCGEPIYSSCKFCWNCNLDLERIL